MKTKDRNELIQKMLEFANIDIEGKQVEYNDQITVFHIIIDKHIYIISKRGGWCEWFGIPNRERSGWIKTNFEP